MNETLRFSCPLRRWTGSRGGSWYLVTASGPAAEEISAHALMQRLEFGHRRGFGSIKVRARIGETCWLTSVFPQGDGQWVMLVKAEVRRAEGLDEGDEIALALELL